MERPGPTRPSCCSAARLRGLLPIVPASPSDVLVCKGDDLAARPETLLLLSVAAGGKESERGSGGWGGIRGAGAGHGKHNDRKPVSRSPVTVRQQSTPSG